jgi:predicted GH43/DUF377 family glycosyl hydrolase
MRWEKKGLIYQPDKAISWMYSHCQLPVADCIGGDIYRVYFASRTLQQRSHIGFVEIDITNPSTIIKVSKEPVLKPGLIGCFDEHGVYPSSIVNFKGKKYLYYIGWNQGIKAPLFYASIGLATSEDNGKSFNRVHEAPIMARSNYDPCLVTSPHVYIEDGIWRMTYVSGVKWEEINGKLKSFYHIKYAESKDGINWNREGIISVDFKNETETNIARSWVIKEDGIYKMWYSYALPPRLYRIGYAESLDGKRFVRQDNLAGLDVSDGGFDSEMMCYPNIIIHKKKKYMFYNGNNFGQEGFGLAVTVE